MEPTNVAEQLSAVVDRLAQTALEPNPADPNYAAEIRLLHEQARELLAELNPHRSE